MTPVSEWIPGALIGDLASLVTLVFLCYFLVINGSYLTINVASIAQIRDHVRSRDIEPVGNRTGNPFVPGVAIVVPAFNEEPVIADSIRSLLTLEYPAYEIVVVNDGSTDGTLDALIEAFDLEQVSGDCPVSLPSAPCRGVYRSPEHELVVLDKENGGKADALNAGLYFTDRPLFCALDADSIIEHGALYDVIEPFLERPTVTVATGGAVRLANGCSFRNGIVEHVSLPENRLVRFQAAEYLRAFLSGRVGLSRLGSLLIISGAFGVFRTDVLREIGGYETDSITEDMELVVRLHRHLIDAGEPYEVTFLARPVVWTEVPESRSVLASQRKRWFRGLLDTLWRHRGAIGRRRYGIVGLFALPFFLFVEALGPLVEGVGYFLVPFLFILGWIDPSFFLAFLALAVGLSTLLSALGVCFEVITYRRYDEPRDVVVLLWYGLLEAFSYRPWKAYQSWRGAVEYLRGNHSWGTMTRVGFDLE